MNMDKLNNENDWEYGLRLLVGKKDGIYDIEYEDIIEKLDLGVNRDSLRKAFNTTKYGGYEIYKYFQNKMIEENKSSAFSDSILELNKSKIKFQEQRKEYNKYLRSDAKFDEMIVEMKKSIDKLSLTSPMYSASSNYESEKYYSGTSACLLLSDWHYGIDTKNYWNIYNPDIAIQRADKIYEKTSWYCKIHNVNELNIEILGDMISGILHLGLRAENKEDIIDQIVNVSEILSNLVDRLAEDIDLVKVHYCTGNHGRVSPNKKESIEKENFERLINIYMQLRIKKTNVIFIDSDLDSTITHCEIDNAHILGTHGHLDSLKDISSNFSKMFKFPIKEIHTGHLHHYFENDEYDISLLMNGSFSGVDTFAKNIRKTGSPSQTLRIYGEDICTYKLELK